MELNRGLRTSMLMSLVILVALSAGLYWYNFRFRTLYDTTSPYFLLPVILYSILILIYLPTRVILYTLYKPFEDRGNRPMVTVIVPAFNEGSFVRKTLKALVNVNYPRDKMQIIAIDDGSCDDTYRHMLSVARRYPSMIKTLRFPDNRGKREAMAEGVKHAKGEIVVFIDSDTVVEKDAIRYMVAPFDNPKIGGVTGKVMVENYKTNFLTRMLGVRYVMSFDFYRCTSSVFGGVTCLSGVISAYRKSILDAVVPEWKRQMFLGRKCTFGDDRSLTNHVLKNGYYTVYSRKAVAHTLAPENLRKMFKMLVRWNRSFTRETIILMRYLLNPKVILKRKMLFFEATLTTVMPFLMMIIILNIYTKIILDPLHLVTVIGSVLAMGMIYMYFYIRSERNWQFVYGLAYAFFFMTILIWILPYAMITIGKTSWGTR
ncbi:MAG: glycosyltransferase [Candidatus Thermoplasmatota archaeon]|nr:glycosyltransferase [Candidatus Thermoplasmatota archaeon]